MTSVNCDILLSKKRFQLVGMGPELLPATQGFLIDGRPDLELAGGRHRSLVALNVQALFLPG